MIKHIRWNVILNALLVKMSAIVVQRQSYCLACSSPGFNPQRDRLVPTLNHEEFGQIECQQWLGDLTS